MVFHMQQWGQHATRSVHAKAAQNGAPLERATLKKTVIVGCKHDLRTCDPAGLSKASVSGRQALILFTVIAMVFCMQLSSNRCTRLVHAQAPENGATPGRATPQKPVIVWYKHDLRTRDHAGLSKALASGRQALAFFCFDPKTLGDQLLHLWGPTVVHGAITDLRKSLEQLGCPLIVRTGDTADELLAVVEQTGADIVSGHSEVEYQWLVVEQAVRERAPLFFPLAKARFPCSLHIMWDCCRIVGLSGMGGLVLSVNPKHLSGRPAFASFCVESKTLGAPMGTHSGALSDHAPLDIVREAWVSTDCQDGRHGR
jgi:hypothetical protein